jgi:hypothetical protein
MAFREDEAQNRFAGGQGALFKTHGNHRTVLREYAILQGNEPLNAKDKEKVNAQWLLFCLVHNIGKCISRMTAAAVSA